MWSEPWTPTRNLVQEREANPLLHAESGFCLSVCTSWPARHRHALGSVQTSRGAPRPPARCPGQASPLHRSDGGTKAQELSHSSSPALPFLNPTEAAIGQTSPAVILHLESTVVPSPNSVPPDFSVPAPPGPGTAGGLCSRLLPPAEGPPRWQIGLCAITDPGDRRAGPVSQP